MAPEGWLVVSAVHGGGRGRAYENEFTAAPADRPFRLPNETRRPKISDSLPARVVSPGDYQYAYIDDKGRYRVRLPFDLDKWSPGGEEHILVEVSKLNPDNFGPIEPTGWGRDVASHDSGVIGVPHTLDKE